MEVTEVRISPAKGGKVRAFASVVFDDCFIVNDLRVIEGREGQVFVTMPARKTRNGQMRDIAHPLDSATRELIEQKVLEEYARDLRGHDVHHHRGGVGRQTTRNVNRHGLHRTETPSQTNAIRPVHLVSSAQLRFVEPADVGDHLIERVSDSAVGFVGNLVDFRLRQMECARGDFGVVETLAELRQRVVSASSDLANDLGDLPIDLLGYR